MSVDYVMHFGICVRDLERSIRFYRDGLGFVEKGRLHIDDAPTAQMMGIPDLVLDAVYLERDGVPRVKTKLTFWPLIGGRPKLVLCDLQCGHKSRIIPQKFRMPGCFSIGF